MAADLHIHVMTDDVSESDLAIFFSNTLGSKWFRPVNVATQSKPERVEAQKRVENTPSVWVGQVSWLKAALFNDEETFVPNVVKSIREIIGENLPVIDDQLIDAVKEAYALGEKRQNMYQIEQAQNVIDFLEQHRGKRAFTISW